MTTPPNRFHGAIPILSVPTVRLPPTNYSWALEIHVEDPDGHVLRFGSDPLPDQPFSEWVMWYGNRYDRGRG